MIRQHLISIIGFCLAAYFAYHIVAGERSYFRLSYLKQQTESVEHNFFELAENKSVLEQKVKMMRPGSIDRDLLEERVRAVLGYTQAGEHILIEER